MRLASHTFKLTCLLICASVIAPIAKTAITRLAPNQSCLSNTAIPSGYVPFLEVHSISAANASGDRVVLGKSTVEQYQQMRSLPETSPNQRFCEPVQLAPNLFAIVYVPSPQERNGDFSPFAGLLIDPLTNQPFVNGIIPANRLGGIFAWRIVSTDSYLTSVSAASYGGMTLASESIVAAYGSGLAGETFVATSGPLPTTLGGTSVRVKDNAGMERPAPLFFVSPNQINYQIPPGTMNGRAALTVARGSANVAFGVAAISTVAPSLFAANANGQGVAAAVALRVRNGVQSFEAVARFDSAQNRFVSIPVDLGPDLGDATDQVFLILFGTGFRFRTALSAVSATLGGTNAEVIYADFAPSFVGMDQANIRLPRSLAGRGEMDVALTVDGKVANAVKLNVQ